MTQDVFISAEGGLFIHKDNFPIHDQFQRAIAMKSPLKNEKANGYYPLNYQTNSFFLRNIKMGLYSNCQFYIISQLFEADVLEQLLDESFKISNLKAHICLVGASLFPSFDFGGKSSIQWKILNPKDFIYRALNDSRQINAVGHTNKICYAAEKLQLQRGGFLSDVYLIDSDTPRLLSALVSGIKIVDAFNSAYVAEIRIFLPNVLKQPAALNPPAQTMQKLL